MILAHLFRLIARISLIAALGAILTAPCRGLADEDGSKITDSFYWVNGRSLIQHYQAMQSSPAEWKVELQPALRLALPKNIEECVASQMFTAEVFDECTRTALTEITADVRNRNTTDAVLLEKLKVFSSVWARFSRISKWESWVRLAAAGVLSGDYRFAAKMIRTARNVLPEDGSAENWKTERLDMFAAALASLDEGLKEGDDKPLKKNVSKEHDPSTQALAREIRRLVSESDAVGGDASEKDTAAKKISDLVRQRWILAQDRDEINALKSMILNNDFSLEAVRRIDNLVRQNQFYSREWQAILKIVSEISGKVELFERSRGLLLPLEWWLGKTGQDNASLSFDDDRLLIRILHIQDEFAKAIGSIAEEYARSIVEPAEVTQATLLQKRMENIISPVSRALRSLPSSEVGQYTQVIRRKALEQDASVRRLQAKLAAVDLTATPDGDLITTLTGFHSELKSLRVQRVNILADYASMSVNLMPATLAGYALLSERTDILRRTLGDLRKLVSGLNRHSLEGTQAGYFFADAEQLLIRISAEAGNHLAAKKAEARQVAGSFRKLAAGISGIREDFNKVMLQTGPQVRVPVSKLLAAIEADIFRQERAVELQEQIHRSEIKSKIAKDRKALDWQRERIEDIRRIKSENLEWRTGR
ncbi:MAG: hypothetical protein EBR09_01780 [Proteobacteria bacterium]|nr:hypothetical protein [Pseudomonadota bacterium]